MAASHPWASLAASLYDWMNKCQPVIIDTASTSCLTFLWSCYLVHVYMMCIYGGIVVPPPSRPFNYMTWPAMTTGRIHFTYRRSAKTRQKGTNPHCYKSYSAADHVGQQQDEVRRSQAWLLSDCGCWKWDVHPVNMCKAHSIPVPEWERWGMIWSSGTTLVERWSLEVVGVACLLAGSYPDLSALLFCFLF